MTLPEPLPNDPNAAKNPPPGQNGDNPNPPPDPNNPNPPAEPQFATHDDLANLNKRLDVFDKVFDFLQKPQQPAQPAQPQGPTLADQVADFDKQIANIDAAIDKAMEDNKPLSKLLAEREKLSSQKIRTQIRAEDIDPAFSSGMQTIDALTDKVTSAEMPYLKIPAVKDRYDQLVGNLATGDRMNPQVRKSLYSMAVGENADEIYKARHEEELRAQQAATQTPSDKGNMRVPEVDPNAVPEPTTILSATNLQAIRLKYGTDKQSGVDAYYRSLGYNDYADWWEKTGKAYYRSEEGGE